MIVYDACALAEIVCGNVSGSSIKRLARENEKAISCDLVRAELISVFRKLARTEHLDPRKAQEYVEEALSLVDEFYPIEELQAEALQEGIRLDHSTYDMFYVVLARRTGATLFTLDRKLMRLCMEVGVNCVQEVEL